MTLVSSPPDSITRTARFSRCGAYRTALVRCWDPGLPPLGFVALNPSTADHRVDDPTVRRMMGFARREGAGGLVLVNLYAFRATRPTQLWKQAHPVGGTTDRVMREVLTECRDVVVCWGALPTRGWTRARRVLARLDRWGHRVWALGLTRHGHPRHPLYLPRAQPLVPWPVEVRSEVYGTPEARGTGGDGARN
jgi:hypothetical protein